MSGGSGRRPDARALILRKVIVSFAIGAFAYLVAELAEQPRIMGVILSVFIGGVVLVTQLLIEFDGRLAGIETAHARHSTQVERIAADGFTKIGEITGLFSQVEASAVETPAITALLRHTAMIGPKVPPLVSRFARTEIGRTSKLLRELNEGTLTYEGEDRDWLLGLVRIAGSRIDATSLTSVDAGGQGFVDGGLWTSDLGHRYLEAQRESIQRGVRIRRVFVVLHAAGPAADAALAATCQFQQDIGIEVRVLDASSIPTTRRDSLFDFVLFDETLSYEVTASSPVEPAARPTILHTRLELRDDRVADRIRRFQDLWESARAPA